MKKVLFALLVSLIFFSSCEKSMKEKLIGKWYGNTIDRLNNKIPLNIKGTIEYKEDNTFIAKDTMDCLYKHDFIRLGGEVNNHFIIEETGTWSIKDNFLTVTIQESNFDIYKNLSSSSKIIELTDSICIDEDHNHKQWTSKRIE